MTTAVVPIAYEAERNCAGLAAAGRNAAAAILGRVAPSDFYHPRHRAILEHALDRRLLDAEDHAEVVDRLEARVVALAIAAGIDVSYVRALALDAAYARAASAPKAVAAAARRRELMNCAAEIYNDCSALTIEQLWMITNRIAELRDEITALEAPDLVGAT